MESQELLDEIGAIELIFPSHVKRLAPLIYNFTVPEHEIIEAQILFPELYPQEKPQILFVNSDKSNKRQYDDEYLETKFKKILEDVFTEDMVCMFEFLSELDMVLIEADDELLDTAEPESQVEDSETAADNEIEELVVPQKELQQLKVSESNKKTPIVVDQLKDWILSDPVTDRKSTFQGFLKEVHSVEEAMDALELLKQDRKIMRASHNIFAYRIKNGEIRYQDYDDDGENAAGEGMSHLLTIMDLWNCIVVVSRWFGGVHIGPSRFKHINSVTREVVVKSGLSKDDKKKATTKSKKKLK